MSATVSRGAAAAAAAGGRAPTTRAGGKSTTTNKDGRQASATGHTGAGGRADAEVESPARETQHRATDSDGDRGAPLFRERARAGPQLVTGPTLPPAPTPARSGGLPAVPDEFKDDSEAWEMGFNDGQTTDLTFHQVMQCYTTYDYNRRALLHGYNAGRNSKPAPPPSAPRGSLDGLTTPAVRARHFFYFFLNTLRPAGRCPAALCSPRWYLSASVAHTPLAARHAPRSQPRQALSLPQQMLPFSLEHRSARASTRQHASPHPPR
jgi:hypothetical protein